MILVLSFLNWIQELKGTSLTNPKEEEDEVKPMECARPKTAGWDLKDPEKTLYREDLHLHLCSKVKVGLTQKGEQELKSQQKFKLQNTYGE